MKGPAQRKAAESVEESFDPDRLAGKRVLVVVAHPDDEVLGCGALLSRLDEVTVAHVTDGAPRDGADARRHGFPEAAAYAEARWCEAEAALALAGVPKSRHIGFGIADQDAAFNLAPLARRLAFLVSSADVVLTHAFEGGHPDHEAVAFAVHAAARLVAAQGSRPAVVEMPFYHAGPSGWARQRFLPHRDAGPEAVLVLSDEEQRLKRRMVEAHRTQASVLAGFGLDVERFRFAPNYDFAVLPNEGQLLYERHDWKLTGERWTTLVAQAAAELGPGQPA